MNSDGYITGIIEKYCVSKTGLHVTETLRKPVVKFFYDRCVFYQCGIDDYLRILDRDPVEYSKLITRLTVNETYFFREERHFRVLEKHILPEFISKPGPVKIWSATCSSGEEAVSLYCIASEILGRDRFNIFATDIDGEMLDNFKTGRYRQNSFREDGSSYHQIILKHSVSNGNGIFVSPDIISNINITNVNLFELGSPDLPEDFDIIFFRNTLIYFNFSERNSIINTVTNRLKPGGLFFLSMTETALVQNSDLQLECLDNVYYFRKKSITNKNGGV